MVTRVDTLIIGCGIGGAAAALRLARDREREIAVITRTAAPEENNTLYAQGGIIARGPGDTAEALMADILNAGAGACLPNAVKLLATDGPPLVEELLIGEAGVAFDRKPNGELSYTKEGGHSAARILHVGDTTGVTLEQGLVRRLEELPNVTLLTELTAVDLITSAHHVADPLSRYQPVTCYGAYVLDQAQGRVDAILANATIVATGGLGRIYKHTTNPKGARGDGLAMAARAGVRIVNAEYVQFHPTTLAAPEGENFLISEAVRGEGGRLYTPDGRAFMAAYSPEWGDLAPRDVVARAIHEEMLKHDYPYVLLNVADHMTASVIRERFPAIYHRCLDAGIDITGEPIPVVPAAHYACGGVLVDEWGRTAIEGLYAVGEVSCTGVHGANRLASTSLLEGLLWGVRAADDIGRGHLGPRRPDIPPWEAVDGPGPDLVLIHQDVQAIQNVMWHYVGLVRNTQRLDRALGDLNHLWKDVENFYQNNRLTDELIGLRNTLQTAWIVTQSAWQNRQSRGTHYRDDAVERAFSSLQDAAPSQPSVSEF